MAKTANLYARIEPELKEQAEHILNSLGLPPSSAITMFYKQVVLQQGLPCTEPQFLDSVILSDGG